MLSKISGLLRIPAVALSLLISCWNMPLSTFRMVNRYYQELIDYAQRHTYDPLVLEFAREYQTSHSRFEYILTRSADLNGSRVGVFATWAGASFVMGLMFRKELAGRGAV
jgi:hypothetical protein